MRPASIPWADERVISRHRAPSIALFGASAFMGVPPHTAPASVEACILPPMIDGESHFNFS